MKRISLVELAAALTSGLALAQVPPQYLPGPSQPAYVQPAPSPSPTPSPPVGVIVPTGPGSFYGAGSVPLPGGGSVSGSGYFGPGNNAGGAVTVTVPTNVGGK